MKNFYFSVLEHLCRFKRFEIARASAVKLKILAKKVFRRERNRLFFLAPFVIVLEGFMTKLKSHHLFLYDTPIVVYLVTLVRVN